MPLLRHEEAKHRTIRQHHRNHGALRMDSQMPRMSERHLDQNTGRQHQNRDPRMEQIRQRRMAQTLGGNEMKVKKTLMDMIVKWHQAGYSLDEISPLVPQVPKEEIKAIIQHTRE